MAYVYDLFLGRIRWTWSAGAGIDMSGGTISVITPPDGVPYIAGPGIGINGATITNTLAGSGRIDVAGGTATFNPIADIVNISGSSVTIEPDTAYKIMATTGAVNVTANPPAANYWGLEGHAEIFVGSVGYVVFDTSKIVLANALEPDSVNNCTLRFHDGMCYISVEDHIAGYIVVSATGTTSGTLPYGIDTATQEYVAFDATLNGSTIDLSGSTANGEKHIVGNGYSETTLTGEVDCGTSKFTVANLTLQNVAVNGGTMTLGDVFIPSGSTVSVSSGGGLNIEKVTGAGSDSVIDFAGNSAIPYNIPNGMSIEGVTLMGASRGRGGLLQMSLRTATISDCVITSNIGGSGVLYAYGNTAYLKLSNTIITGNSSTAGYGTLWVVNGATCELTSCYFHDNFVYIDNDDVYVSGGNATLILSGSTITQGIRVTSGGSVSFKGPNVLTDTLDGPGVATISSGAIVVLNGNTNAAPIDAGGGITIYGGTEQNPTKILFSSGASGGSRAFEIGEITGSTITNLGIVLGATVTNTSGDADVKYSSDDGATVSSYLIVGSGTFEVPEGAGLLGVQSV